LLSIPTIFGAALVKLGDISSGAERVELSSLLLGGASALISGYFAISILLKVMRKRRLDVFAYYCFGAAFSLYLIL
jgi:undecaprenyl-diphosphatase